jgi:formate-dependent nitrite reductase membrane component NrfD
MSVKPERQRYWRWKIAFYLFLAGTGAGAYMVAVLADVFWPEAVYLSKKGVLMGTGLVILGIPFLILDLGRKGRFFRAGVDAKIAWIGRGFYILSIFTILGVIHIGFWIWPFNFLEIEKSFRITLSIINGVFAFGIALYTGLLLRSMNSIHFWDTPLIVILFFISALSSGVVSLVLTSISHFAEAKGGGIVLNLLLTADLLLIFLEFLILGFYLLTMHDATEASKKSVLSLVKGDLSLLFWGGIIVCGLITPFILKCIEIFYSELAVAGPVVISSLLILIGALLLRYGILAAGVQVTPLLPNCR